MAETKMYTVKKYSDEAKEKLKFLLEETKEAREALDLIDQQMRTTQNPTGETLKDWSLKAVGYGNYLRKKFKRLESAVKNEKGNRYMEIKLECNQLGITFVHSVAEVDSETYVGPIRVLRDLFEGYVLGAESVTSICKAAMYYDKKESNQPEI
jgi:predicted RNA-binding protein YlxR (DUF448 family)